MYASFSGGALDLADEEATQAQPKSTTSSSAASLSAPDLATAGVTSTNSSSSSAGSGLTPDELLALQLCALRETFEETGLLLVPLANEAQGGQHGATDAAPRSRAIGHKEAGMSAQEWAKIRDEVSWPICLQSVTHPHVLDMLTDLSSFQVHDDATHFVPFLKRVSAKLNITPSSEHDRIPQLASIAHHTNWITPRSVVRPAKRFDAHFFLTVLDTPDALLGVGQWAGETVPVAAEASRSDSDAASAKPALALSADGTETLSLRVGTPNDLITLALQDRVVLFPPQFYVSRRRHFSFQIVR